MFYETRYYGKFSKGLIFDDVTKDLKYSMSDVKKGPDEYSKQHATIVQLGYVEDVLEEEISNMSERKMVDYTLANSHILKSEIQNIIYEMSRKSQIVKDIMAKKLEFISDPRNRYISYNHAMDLRAKYYDGKVEGKDEEREIQRQKMQDVVVESFKLKYNSDSKFLEDLTLDDYNRIVAMLLNDCSIEDIETFVGSLR
ncbi:MAG: hypothetical protein LUG46_05820 [Erysipelotrichaceae bacterium]|nr:hypothetical protein [Erysipelotrichaceae bacterium]